jgi:mannose-1-phosphate guanylyltransferase/mannose-6-phosphate isomerase
MGNIVPVILCGGEGIRLWPLTAPGQPKPLLSLYGNTSLLMATISRIFPHSDYLPPIIVTSAPYVEAVDQELARHNLGHLLRMIEPAPRDTAAAITAAGLMIRDLHPDAHMLVLPADHRIEDDAAFHAAVSVACQAADKHYLTSFGITPTHPDTGYGYIRSGETIADGIFAIELFKEKPDIHTATDFVARGYVWNSGMFLFPISRLLEEMETYAMGILAAAEEAVATMRVDDTHMWLGDAFAQAARQPIDRAVMERTSYAAVVPVSLGWSDVGSYTSLWQHATKDSAGNAITGAARIQDAANNFIHVPGCEISLLGVSDLIIVHHAGKLLIAHKDKIDQLKTLLETASAETETAS